MARDITDIVGEYLSEDPTRWGKLSSNIQWRRMQLLLLREILVELRKLTVRTAEKESSAETSPTVGQ
ncbi:MAG TPA: hypothetical protein VMC62_12705 [Longilinea sp.]|nr:hypothetical protein [Longilinea sp.]